MTALPLLLPGPDQATCISLKQPITQCQPYSNMFETNSRNSQKLKGIWDRSVWILMKSRSWIKYVIVCCIGQNLFVGYKYILPPGTSYSNQSLKKYAWPLKELECMTHAMPCKCTEIMNVSGRCVRFIWQTNDIKQFRSIHRIPQSMLTRDPKHPQTSPNSVLQRTREREAGKDCANFMGEDSYKDSTQDLADLHKKWLGRISINSRLKIN